MHVPGICFAPVQNLLFTDGSYHVAQELWHDVAYLAFMAEVSLGQVTWLRLAQAKTACKDHCQSNPGLVVVC